MNDSMHIMHVEASYPGEYLFVCPHEDCGRRLVFKTGEAAEMIVLDEGDPMALHRGSTPGMGSVEAKVEAEE